MTTPLVMSARPTALQAEPRTCMNVHVSTLDGVRRWSLRVQRGDVPWSDEVLGENFDLNARSLLLSAVADADLLVVHFSDASACLGLPDIV